MRQFSGLDRFAGGTVDEIDILISVIVVVEKSSSLAIDVNQVFSDLITTGDLVSHPGLSGHVGENRQCADIRICIGSGLIRYERGSEKKYQQQNSLPE